MSQKLDQYSHLEKENQSLRNINELHIKTQVLYKSTNNCERH